MLRAVSPRKAFLLGVVVGGSVLEAIGGSECWVKQQAGARPKRWFVEAVTEPDSKLAAVAEEPPPYRIPDLTGKSPEQRAAEPSPFRVPDLSGRSTAHWLVMSLLAIALLVAAGISLALAGNDNGCLRRHLLDGNAALALMLGASAVALLTYALVVFGSVRHRVRARVVAIPIALALGGLVFGIGVAMMYSDWACTG